MSVAGPSSTFFAWLRIGTAFGSLAINAVANFAPGANSPPLPSDEHRWIGGQGKGRAIHPKNLLEPRPGQLPSTPLAPGIPSPFTNTPYSLAIGTCHVPLHSLTGDIPEGGELVVGHRAENIVPCDQR